MFKVKHWRTMVLKGQARCIRNISLELLITISNSIERVL